MKNHKLVILRDCRDDGIYKVPRGAECWVVSISSWNRSYQFGSRDHYEKLENSCILSKSE